MREILYFLLGGIPLRNLEERIKHRKSMWVPTIRNRISIYVQVVSCAEKNSAGRSLSPSLHYLLPSPLSFQPFLKNAAPTTAQDFQILSFSHRSVPLWSSLFHKQFVVTMVTHD